MKNDVLVLTKGMEMLRTHLGLVEAELFINLVKRDPFDYTVWQRTLWVDKTVDELMDAASQ